MTTEELYKQYYNVPRELKDLTRWVCWKGNKIPVNASNGSFAKTNDSSTWTSFDTAINGCVKYNCLGLGFVLGDGIFGVDLDNHEGEGKLSEVEFYNIANDFIDNLNSYTEKSQSGKGIHIICKGALPQGRRRKDNVEMYDSGRFFVFTGNVINSVPIENREKEIIPLWSKYVNVVEEVIPTDDNAKYNFSNFNSQNSNVVSTPVILEDSEILSKAFASKNGSSFMELYNGSLTEYNGDHSAADMALCMKLAFWTNNNYSQIDRIFRSSGLMRPKWDEMRGANTYGYITITNAISKNAKTYVKQVKQNIDLPIVQDAQEEQKSDNYVDVNFVPDMTIDENGDPIFKNKKIFKTYPYNDTGNAERFYDHFGDVFRYNKQNKTFMYWTGKTWVVDTKDIIRKYANKFIDILKDEANCIKTELFNTSPEETTTISKLKKQYEEAIKNIAKVSNKAGKDTMLYEFQSLYNIPVINDDFDQDKYLLNTDSGVVDLRTGTLSPFNPNLMLSKNTNIKISYEEPKTWLKFLYDVFDRNNEEETKEIIECLQMAIGYSLSGSTKEQVMFILWGDGSNGKSTLSETIAKVVGDYGSTTESDTLMAKSNNSANNVSSALARLKGVRYVQTGETDDNAKLNEALVKRITGSDKLTVRFLYGNEFEYYPEFKIWMSTNSKPIIRGTNYGIWRRIYMFPFVNTFTGAKKDKSMPDKLDKELPQILGWCIKGFLKYQEQPEIKMPKCLSNEITTYKKEMDVLTQFMDKNCVSITNYFTPTKTFYAAYKQWAINESEFIMKNSKVEDEMRKKGYKIVKDCGVPSYVGIMLLSEHKTAYVFNNYDKDNM